MKFKAKGWEFAKILRSLEQFIQAMKGQNNWKKNIGIYKHAGEVRKYIYEGILLLKI